MGAIQALNRFLRPSNKAANTWVETAAMSFGSYSPGAKRSISINYAQTMTYIEAAGLGYKSNVWVAACTDLKAKALASARWKVTKKTGTQEILGHELVSLIDNPNPFMTKTDLMANIACSYNLSGCIFLHKVLVERRLRGKGKVPKMLWLMRPDWVAPIVDNKTFIDGFEIRAGVRSGEKLPNEEVIYCFRPDPLVPYIGASPLSSAARSLQSEDGAYAFNQSLLLNYAQPSGVLSTDSSMNADDHMRLREEVEEAYSGENLYRPLVLTNGLKWQQMSISPVDMQFQEARTTNKMEVCAALGTPPILVGALAESNYANYIAARVSYMEDHIIPFLIWMRDTFNRTLTPYWGDDIMLDFDVSKTPSMRKAYMDRVVTAEKLINIRFPLNAVNEQMDLGFEPVPWGDVSWMPTSVMPVDGPEFPEAPMTEEPEKEDDEYEDESDTDEPKTPPGGKVTDDNS